jgi:hypothetical protein
MGGRLRSRQLELLTTSDESSPKLSRKLQSHVHNELNHEAEAWP